MGLLDLFGFYWLLRFLFPAGSRAATALNPQPYPPTPTPTRNGKVAPVTWPAAPPSTLPPFPGAGWEYDEPPPPEVVKRATELLQSLWAKGSGSKQQEMTGGRWITYVAEVVRGGSRGVTAYRVKGTAPARAAAPGTPYAPPPGPRAPAPTAATAARPAAVPASYSPTMPTAAPPAAPVGPAMSTSDVQSALNTLGYSPPLTVDGKQGPLTTAAIKWWQQGHGLVVDGIAGPLTKASLATALATQHAAAQPIPVAAPAPVAPVVATNQDVQSALNTLGYSPPLVVDGILGAKSVAGIKWWQSTHSGPPDSLKVDGIAGPMTKASLSRALGAVSA